MTNIMVIIIILCVFSVLGLISYFVYNHITNGYNDTINNRNHNKTYGWYPVFGKRGVYKKWTKK